MCNDAPCFSGCPAGVNPRKFIRKIRFGNLAGAVRLIRTANILAGSCSYICPCLSTCSGKCTSDKLDRPIDIIGLQRYVCEWERTNGMVKPLPGTKTGKRVAVIGSGPAGLACAAELAVRGHVPVVFDEAGEAGGMLRQAIPDFRLPREMLDFEIDIIRALGVEFQLGVKVDDANKLLSDGFSAVFIGTGVGLAKKAGLTGEDKPGVFQALDFLRAAKKGAVELPADKRAVVIGGGDTAIDAARVLKRAGCRVMMVYRRTRADMPAYRPDIAIAEQEGIEIIFNTVVRSITGTDGVQGVRCVRVRWSEAGRVSTGYSVEGNEFPIPCGIVVQATGQEPGTLFDLRTSPKNYIAVDHKMMTSTPGIFAGGDIVSGPATAVEAVAQGKLAAGFVDEYLGTSEKRYNRHSDGSRNPALSTSSGPRRSPG
jgi:NADPH-dependent glutamate synthase beta subunit-like oxidoreductase